MYISAQKHNQWNATFGYHSLLGTFSGSCWSLLGKPDASTSILHSICPAGSIGLLLFELHPSSSPDCSQEDEICEQKTLSSYQRHNTTSLELTHHTINILPQRSALVHQVHNMLPRLSSPSRSHSLVQDIEPLQLRLRLKKKGNLQDLVQAGSTLVFQDVFEPLTFLSFGAVARFFAWVVSGATLVEYVRLHEGVGHVFETEAEVGSRAGVLYAFGEVRGREYAGFRMGSVVVAVVVVAVVGLVSCR